MTSEARAIFNVFQFALLLSVLITILVMAWLKGRRAERYGSTLYAASFFGTMALEICTGQNLPVVPELFLDTVVALGFLGLAIYCNNLWLGGAMMIKGVQLGLHASHLTEGADPKFLGLNMYATGLNLISLLIMLTILGGTLASMKARRISGAQAGSAPTSRQCASSGVQAA